MVKSNILIQYSWDDIIDGVFGIREEREYDEWYHSKLECITELFTRDLGLKGLYLVLGREEYQEQYREDHGDHIMTEHDDDTNEIREKCCILTRYAHAPLLERAINIRYNEEYGRSKKSNNFPDMATDAYINPSHQGSHERHQRIRSDSSDAGSSTMFVSWCGHLTFYTDESPEKNSEDKVPKKKLIHSFWIISEYRAW